MISFKDIKTAAEKISPFIHRTPLVHSNSLSNLSGADVYIKAENLQKTGSFKVRGAFNKLLSIKDANVITASMGNHAQGVAYAAGRLGIQAKIVMPVSSQIIKQVATKGYGAELILHGESFNEALEFALQQEDYTFIHAFDDKAVIAGQGSTGIEIIEDLKDIDFVVAPVGGGGLLSGISVAIRELSPKTDIIGVQTESALSAYQSFRKRCIVDSPTRPTLADGIAVKRIGDIPFELIMKYVDDIVSVEEDSIAMAILLFLERTKLVVEGAAAVSLAALLKYKDMFYGKRVVIVVSGGNIDFTVVDRIIHKGLMTSGRIGIFEVKVDDVPGKLHLLTGVIAERRGNILNIVHDRVATDLSVNETRVIFTVETRSRDHCMEIINALQDTGVKVTKMA